MNGTTKDIMNKIKELNPIQILKPVKCKCCKGEGTIWIEDNKLKGELR
jgi:hypothetical protein